MIIKEFKPYLDRDGNVNIWYALVEVPIINVMVERQLLVENPRPLDQFTEVEIEEYRQKAITFPTTEPIFVGNPTPIDPPPTNPQI